MDMINTADIADLKTAIAEGHLLSGLLPQCVGGKGLEGGMWRLFSKTHPSCGLEEWNQEWCSAWGITDESVLAFGEDIFGNQLLVVQSHSTIYLCDHENGSCHDLELEVIDLLDSVVHHGIEWIDFYSKETMKVGRYYLPRLTWEQHVHWTQPLILNGEMTMQNTSIVDRLAHMQGHAQLWAQVSGLSHGDEVHLQ